jgi:hypothetical protein
MLEDAARGGVTLERVGAVEEDAELQRPFGITKDNETIRAMGPFAGYDSLSRRQAKFTSGCHLSPRLRVEKPDGLNRRLCDGRDIRGSFLGRSNAEQDHAVVGERDSVHLENSFL